MGEESACPFCGAALPTTSPRRSYAATLGLSLGLMTAACSAATSSDDGGSTGAGSGSATEATSLSAPSASTGGDPTSTSDGAMTSTGTETGVDDETTDDPDDQGGSFYAGSPDTSTGEMDCDLFEQDCPLGEKCMPWGSTGGTWDATACRQVANDPQQVDEACTVEGSGTSGIDNCDIGLMCFDVDDKTNTGTCTALCEGSLAAPLCDDVSAVCAVFNDGNLPICIADCHPLAQDCEDGDVCIPVNDGANFACVATSEAVPVGEACDDVNSCAAGLACLQEPADCGPGWGCCRSYCDTSLGDPDATCTAIAPGQVCEPWYQDPAPPGFGNLGICQ